MIPLRRDAPRDRLGRFSPTGRGHPDDRLREECGVFGVLGHDDAAALTALGLHALQHRGQEAAGIVTFDGAHFHSERRLGLVGDNFNKADVIGRLKGHIALGHNRYSTTGDTVLRNVQPLFADLDTGGFAVAHNGNLTNALTLRRELISSGAICQSTSDTEVILHLISRSRRRRIVERFVDALLQIEGAYALVCLTNDMLIGARDPVGIRPLVLGKLGSRLRAHLGDLRARHRRRGVRARDRERRDRRHHRRRHREPPPVPEATGAALHLRVHLLRAARFHRRRAQRLRHPQADGRWSWRARRRPWPTWSIPIPDSGVPAAIGYAQESGMPFELGIIRNHYVGRTFIEPEQRIRQLGVKLKHSANAAAVRGNRIVLIDDSVVRGTTSKKIVQMMFEAGAREVHFRVACPPIAHPDFYGIDTPRTTELLAANMSVEDMCRFMGATSLSFLSVDGVYRALGYERRDARSPQFTDHCFTGDYPTSLTDQHGPAHVGQLSLLTEVS